MNLCTEITLNHFQIKHYSPPPPIPHVAHSTRVNPNWLGGVCRFLGPNRTGAAHSTGNRLKQIDEIKMVKR